MSSAQVQRPVKVDGSEERSASKNKIRLKEIERLHRKSGSGASGYFPKKHKHETDGRNFKRKRVQSFPMGGGKFCPPYKRRKKEGTIIPPTKFLLGGNINDPLNLNSLQDEEINRAMNAVTPKSSPLPTPRHRKGTIEVIIPPNLHDPLNLISCEDDAEYEQTLVSPTKRGRKSRNRKKKRNSSSGGSSKEDGLDGSAPVMNSEGVKIFEEEKASSLNENVVFAAPISTQENPARRELHLELPAKEKDRKSRKGTEDSAAGKDSKLEKKRKPDIKDKIVSPVIPQPGAWKRPPQYGPASDGRFSRFRPGANWQHKREQMLQKMPNFKKKNEYFQYGNYLKYYGYRNPQHEVDIRLKYLEKRKELFQDKDVLDIGCNIGHVTLIVARDFKARSVVGLDIDRKLIAIARKNVRHYVNYADSPPNDEPGGGGGGGGGIGGSDGGEQERSSDSKFFPISLPILYGPVDIPSFSHGQSPSASKKFPHNVTFVQGNYVVESDALLATEQPQFDVILCLSITKWLHLNWGDAGLKQAFRRMYLQLRPGGHLILEPQAWESYKKKKNLTETIFKNYNSIEFLPQKFTEYLLSSEVGFTQCEVIGTPFHQSKGFQRPIQLFTKGEISPSRSVASNTNTPSYTVVTGASRPPVYVPVSISTREVDDDGDEDDTVRHNCAVETYRKHRTSAEGVVAMEEDGTEKLGEQDAVDGHFHQNVEIKSDIPVIKGGSPPVSTSDGGVIAAVDVDSSISNTESHLIVHEWKEVEFESTIIHEGMCTNIKSEVEIVSDSLRGQEEVVSVRFAKVDTESDKLICDTEDGNIESVKMEKILP
ncbi:hypothetical protein B7P43_G07788 [Cryptotermes secundus]|uniref:RNA methyltransferase n=3 Tax=Cryptotermes secundus TaxID=105785 RepID=A0A2J7PJJ5_9NEOP|nr:probable RNA methyltransferase bin3 isoform X2 [Cryptotermes secundus]PNF16503.1 hypothetical protein B7P43_G07788 [Cryptotermes secundus]